MPLEFAQTEECDVELAPPRCRGCGYVLLHLETARCPECGREFDPRDPESFIRKPPFLFWRFWLPALVLGALIEFLVALIFVLQGEIGWGLAFGAPFALGAFLGYSVRGGILGVICAAVAGGAAIIGALIASHPAGLICGLVLGIVFIVPLLLGASAGALLRLRLKKTAFSQRAYLPAILMLIAIPFSLHRAEKWLDLPRAPESIQTAIDIDAPVSRVWSELMFYEEVRHEPPWILRLGLPRPMRTVGTIRAAGDYKICVYEHGRLCKRVTQYTPPNRLEFDVTQQFRVQDHAIRLTRGSFDLQPLPNARTRITLTTQYEPLMTPRWCWRPFEALICHALHRHVLEGIRLKSTQPTLAVPPILHTGPRGAKSMLWYGLPARAKLRTLSARRKNRPRASRSFRAPISRRMAGLLMPP